MYTHLDGRTGASRRQVKSGLIAEERRPHLTNSVVGDPRVGDQEWARREGWSRSRATRSWSVIPGRRVAMFSRRALPEDTLEALSSVANVIAQGIVRRRAEAELSVRARARRLLEEVSTPVVPVLERAGAALTARSTRCAWSARRRPRSRR